jgi:hypothetical protein
MFCFLAWSPNFGVLKYGLGGLPNASEADLRVYAELRKEGKRMEQMCGVNYDPDKSASDRNGKGTRPRLFS